MSEYGDAFVVKLRWRPIGADREREQFQVLRVRDGKVQQMHDYRTALEAAKAARKAK